MKSLEPENIPRTIDPGWVAEHAVAIQAIGVDWPNHAGDLQRCLRDTVLLRISEGAAHPPQQCAAEALK